MELRHLRYFVAVADEENVTRAAVRLLSQPALTRQVRDLEEELGFDLFVRSGKSLRLTDGGRVFHDEARAVLARLQQAVENAQEVAAGGTGTLHIGYAPSPSVGLLSQARELFQHANPKARVVLHDETTPHMLAGLRARQYHLALLMQPPRTALAGVAFESLRTLPIVVATHPAHPLGRGRSLRLGDVLHEPVVAFSLKEYPDYRALLRRVLGGGYDRLRIVEECDTGMSLIAAVEAGRGVAFTIDALRESAGRRLRFVRLRPALSGVMGVAYIEGERSVLSDRFLAALRSTAKV